MVTRVASELRRPISIPCCVRAGVHGGQGGAGRCWTEPDFTVTEAAPAWWWSEGAGVTHPDPMHPYVALPLHPPSAAGPQRACGRACAGGGPLPGQRPPGE